MDKQEKQKIFNKLKGQIESQKNLKREEFLSFIVRTLKNSVPHYDWVGLYFADGDRQLILDVYEGEPTIHTKIKFGEGICGQAAISKRTFLVPDVNKETNYLSCSIKVKSEIVVPILKDEIFIGELDIDSHALNAFDELDRAFMEEICRMVAEKLDC